MALHRNIGNLEIINVDVPMELVRSLPAYVGEVTRTSDGQIYVEGFVWDAKTNQIVPGVTVQLFYTPNGGKLTEPFQLTDGFYSAWTDMDPALVELRFTAQGYKTRSLLISELVESADVYLSPGTSGSFMWIALAAAGVTVIALNKPKKKVGKAGGGLYKYYQGMHPIAKGLIGIGITYVAYRTLDKLLSDDPGDDEPEAAKTELQQLAAQGIFPTYSDTQFESFSQNILQAVNGWGTDEDSIYLVMEAMNNKADILKLIMIFDVREWEDISVPFQLKKGSLSIALHSDLNSGEINTVNEILRANGINYKF